MMPLPKIQFNLIFDNSDLCTSRMSGNTRNISVKLSIVNTQFYDIQAWNNAMSSTLPAFRNEMEVISSTEDAVVKSSFYIYNFYVYYSETFNIWCRLGPRFSTPSIIWLVQVRSFITTIIRLKCWQTGDILYGFGNTPSLKIKQLDLFVFICNNQFTLHTLICS